MSMLIKYLTKMRRLLIFLYASFLVIFVPDGHTKTLILEQDKGVYELKKYGQIYFNYDNKNLDLNTLENQVRWQNAREVRQHPSINTYSKWFKFNLENNMSDVKWYLSFGYARLPLLKIFILKDGQLVKLYELDKDNAFNDRPLKTPQLYIPLPEEAKKYANYVIQNVESLYHTFEDPLRMVEIANMEYVFGDKQKAYKLLLVAENKFGDRNDPVFHLELNTNKGHIFYQWKNYQRAERFYRRAVNWINNTGHDDKLMVAYSNLARVNQFLLKYEEALTYYQKSYALLQLQQDNNFIYVIALRIAEVKLKMKDIDEAIDYFELVEFDELSPHYHESYISLLKALNVEQ